MASGAHYNPLKAEHGAPESKVRHVGDLGNIIADGNGKAQINVTDSIALLDGPHSIMNRAIVIHKDVDDLGLGGANDSKKTGHAGARVLCGVIRKV
jgi:Cu-Zn family superoxide dismutase